MSSLPASDHSTAIQRPAPKARAASPKMRATRDSITVLIVVPTLDVGAADAGAVGLTRILTSASYRVIAASRPGRMVADVTAAGGEFVALNIASHNPITVVRNTFALMRIARARKCDVVHALGRAAAWSAYLAARVNGVPFLT